jgi:acetyl esterase/lipase
VEENNMNSRSSLARLVITFSVLATLISACASTPVVATFTPKPTTVPNTPSPTPKPTAVPNTPSPTPSPSPLRISKTPELILAVNKPFRKTDDPDHVVYTLPGMDKVLMASELNFSENLLMDIYYPPDYQFNTKLPVVILLHDFSDQGGQTSTNKDIQQQIDWAKLFAASGMIVVSAQAGEDPYLTFNSMMDYLNANADLLGIDMNRIGFWGCSGHCLFLWRILGDSPYRDNFRAAALYYCYFIKPDSWPKNISLFVVRAGQDSYVDSGVMDRLLKSARDNNIPVQYTVLPEAVHGFDIYQDVQMSKDMIKQTLDFFTGILLNNQ